MSNLGGTRQSEDTDDAAVSSTITTKGDIEGFSTVPVRIPVGTNGQRLEADSTEASGVKWVTPASGSNSAGMARRDSDDTGAGGLDIITWETEEYDDDGFIDIAGGATKITVPTGVTRVNISAYMHTTGTVSGASNYRLFIEKFSAGDSLIEEVAGISSEATTTDVSHGCSSLGLVVVAGEYFKVSHHFLDTVVTLDYAYVTIQDVSP